MKRIQGVVIGGAIAFSGATALGVDFAFEPGLTAGHVIRVIDTPEGPMAVCGNPRPEDAAWFDDLNLSSEFDAADSFGGAAPLHAGAVPGPGTGGVALMSGLMLARRRRR